MLSFRPAPLFPPSVALWVSWYAQRSLGKRRALPPVGRSKGCGAPPYGRRSECYFISNCSGAKNGRRFIGRFSSRKADSIGRLLIITVCCHRGKLATPDEEAIYLRLTIDRI